MNPIINDINEHPRIVALRDQQTKELDKLKAQISVEADVEFATGIKPKDAPGFMVHFFRNRGAEGSINFGDWANHSLDQRVPIETAARLLVNLPPVPLVKQVKGWTAFVAESHTGSPDFEGGQLDFVAPLLLTVDAATAGSIDRGPVITKLEWMTRLDAGLFHVSAVLASHEVANVRFTKKPGPGRFDKPSVIATHVTFHPRWCKVVGEKHADAATPLARDSLGNLTSFGSTRFGGGDGVHYGSRYVYHHPDPRLDVVEWVRQVAAGGIR